MLLAEEVLNAVAHVLHKSDREAAEKAQREHKAREGGKPQPRTGGTSSASSSSGSGRPPLAVAEIHSQTPAAVKAFLPPSAGCTAKLDLKKSRWTIEYPEQPGPPRSASKAWGERTGLCAMGALQHCLETVWGFHTALHPDQPCPWDFSRLVLAAADAEAELGGAAAAAAI